MPFLRIPKDVVPLNLPICLTSILSCRRKVERVGNLNFPAEIRNRHLTGSLALEVALNSDGSIRELSLDDASGQPLLDDSAQRIVKLAAPFAPFPAAIRRDTAVLRFVYVWRFNGGKRLGGVQAAEALHN